MSASSPRRRMTRRSPHVRVWPEPFVEALAFQVAIDAYRLHGRLAASPALFNVFQVCSTWRAVSRSELLWQNLSRQIWNAASPHPASGNSWRDEFIYRHRTATNFRLRRHTHVTLHLDNHDDTTCCRLALSDHHLAAGFSDGGVHLFHLPTRLHVSTFFPQQREGRLGRFSTSVSGIIFIDSRLVFSTLDGDIHVAILDGGQPLHRAHVGDVVNDGALVDFSGSSQWWVGLYAGVPGRAFHIWNSETEELVFVGGTLTDPEAVMGWHQLTERRDPIGRVRVTSGETAVACTGGSVIVLDLRNQGVVLGEEGFRRGVIVGMLDSNGMSVLIGDGRGRASLRRVVDLEEVCRFTMRHRSSMVLGCVNGGYGVVFGGGLIRVWGIENGAGEYLYSLRERIAGECNAIAADDTCVAASDSDGIIHVWDFGAP